MQMANVNIPDDIIQNILARLPTKPLLRSRCVSTHWNHLVSDPYFMNARLRRKILLVAPEFHALEVNEPCGDDMVRLHYPFECRTDGGVRDIRVIGTFTGIVVLVVNDHKDGKSKSANFTSHIILYNPFTGASEIIPDPYSPFYDNFGFTYGFGYGATKDQLKIVRFRNVTHRNDNCYNCDVFNLKERSWSTKEILMKDNYFWCDVGTFLNGSLYWVAYKKIVSLDVNEMVISEINLPCKRIESENHLFTLHGCLSLITRHKNSHSNKFNMWVMTNTEQGVKNSWSKSRLLTLDYPMADEDIIRGSVQILTLMDDGRILIKGARNELIIYDTSKFSYKFLKPSPSYIKYYEDAIEYQESLISTLVI
ncbi:F-box domain containing protein [Tanacetum coccineum]